MFAEVYPEIAAGRPIGFTDISNAIAVFIAFEWRLDDSPFGGFQSGEATRDHFTAGERAPCHIGQFCPKSL